MWYPPHPPRKASALYSQTHHRLVALEDRPCVVCGVRNSTLLVPTNNLVHAKAIETHHALIEWAGANAIDWDKLAADHPDLRTLMQLASAYHAHLLANDGTFGGKLDPAIVTAFVDSPDQMLVICDVHHRSSGKGVHMITGPIWELQRYERGDWDFTGGGEPPAPPPVPTP